MYYSDLLRKKISKLYSLDIEKYVWTNELNDTIMNMKLHYFQEEPLRNMSDVYKYGFNIGYCGLTSRHYALYHPVSQLMRGYLPILKGTMNSINGIHMWIVKDSYIIDFTLRIKVPVSQSSDIGYNIISEIPQDGDKNFSEYELYPSYLISDPEKLSIYQAKLLDITDIPKYKQTR